MKRFFTTLTALLVLLIAPASPDSPLAQLIEKRGEGIDSIGFTVADVHAASDAIEGAGGRMTGSQGGGVDDMAWLHPKNPLGLSLELLRSDFWAGAVKPQ